VHVETDDKRRVETSDAGLRVFRVKDDEDIDSNLSFIERFCCIEHNTPVLDEERLCARGLIEIPSEGSMRPQVRSLRDETAAPTTNGPSYCG
jgi:hypothetical protein